MVVGVARVTLHIAASQSLKDKRQVLRSLLAQVGNRFAVAVAEVDQQDQWQIAVVGLAYVSDSGAHADEVIAKAVNFLATRKAEADVLDFQTEIIHAF